MHLVTVIVPGSGIINCGNDTKFINLLRKNQVVRSHYIN